MRDQCTSDARPSNRHTLRGRTDIVAQRANRHTLRGRADILAQRANRHALRRRTDIIVQTANRHIRQRAHAPSEKERERERERENKQTERERQKERERERGHMHGKGHRDMDKVAAQAGAGLRAPLQPFIFEYPFCPCTLVAILECETGRRSAVYALCFLHGCCNLFHGHALMPRQLECTSTVHVAMLWSLFCNRW